MNHTVTTSLSNPADRAAAEERLRKKRLADAAPDMYAFLVQALPVLEAHHRNSTEGAPTIVGIRALLARIDGRE